MNTTIKENDTYEDEVKVYISYIESVLKKYKKQLNDIKKSNPYFSEHFIPASQADKLKYCLKQLKNLEGEVVTLLPEIMCQMSQMSSFEYVTSMRTCLLGSAPEAIRLFTFLERERACNIEQKLMGEWNCKEKSLVEATDAYNSERDVLSNKAVDKERFLKEFELENTNMVISLNNNLLRTIYSDDGDVTSRRTVNLDTTVGDIITFGKYPQGKDGKVKPIEWLVLVKKRDRILLISRYALDFKRYNEGYGDTTWESCSIRRWLNSDFINIALSKNEKAATYEVTVTANRNPAYNTNPGNNTKDRVFLLSITEAEKYFSNNENRKCISSAYAIGNEMYSSGSFKVEGKRTSWWWLRSPGLDGGRATLVDYGGSIYPYGSIVYGERGGVRPALWIKL